MKNLMRNPRFQLFSFIGLALLELLLVHRSSDLPIEVGNWLAKATDIAHLKIPTDNFYGPGAALLITPFLWAKNHLLIAIIFYYLIGIVGYWKIVEQIDNRNLRLIALAGFLSNFYLVWLINSSQDTVFEFALLTWSLYFLIQKKYFPFSLVTFLLCETRSGYWIYYLGVSTLFLLLDFMRRNFKWQRYLAFASLIVMIIFNGLNYGTISPSLEGGITSYFSYTKYHYLALPKMDMDVFLSGSNGAFSPNFGPKFTGHESASEQNSIYFKAALKSISDNPKESILGWMQKFDSYIFEAQKVPQLPGSYVLDMKSKTIQIGDERLRWPLVIGNLLYEFYRSLLFIGLIFAICFVLIMKLMFDSEIFRRIRTVPLVFPWIFGLIPAILIYSETRFKIVSEVLLIPFIVEIIALMLNSRASYKTR